ncbi:hypothetical protein GOODEAATRI_032702 [Goodea atripinnis]|uniref:Uncharacterized protein n=1 Tax=Goodea atripinnis TaxID=208336 RepID=A0ABV0MMP4_9TELE
MSRPCGTKNNINHLVPDSSQAPGPPPASSPTSNMVLQCSSFPLPPANIQAVESDRAERFLAKAQLEQIRPPGHIYCSTPGRANKACPMQLSCTAFGFLLCVSFCNYFFSVCDQLLILNVIALHA